jgi:outer membrane lipoprotein SlyB
MSAWDKTKKWVNRNPTLSGAIAGFTAGTVVPGVGNVIGALGGAVIGHMAGQDKKKKTEE